MDGINREEIIAAFPLAAQMEKAGLKLIGGGPTKKALCPFHSEKTPSLSVNVDKGLWFCFGCRAGGSVVDFIARLSNRQPEEVFKELAGQLQRRPTPSSEQEASGRLVDTYLYRTATGEDSYRVLRYEPKTFRQQRWVGGAWAWGMEGVVRVLYNLPEILAAGDKLVVIVEGEKDAATLTKLGWVATTSVGGAGKWLAGYGDTLKGRNVAVCGDNDEPGRKHVRAVIDALDGKCASLRHLVVPAPSKDVTEYLAGFGAMGTKESAFQGLIDKAAVLVAGSTVPILSMAEMEDRYEAQLKRNGDGSYSFSSWLPTFGFKIRPSMPGDVIAFVAGTGVGKTCLLQNMAFRAAPLSCLLFEMELADSITFERFVAGVTGMSQEEVEKAYRSGNKPDWRDTGYLQNIFVCPSSGLTVPDIETIVNRAELKMGVRPLLVMIDYVQLVRGLGKGRYEQMTGVMADLKSMAKNTGTVVAVASQVQRKGEDSKPDIGLESGKDSGQIENSSALHIGVWRDPKERDGSLVMRINKNTRGRDGLTIRCNFDGCRMLVTEKESAS